MSWFTCVIALEKRNATLPTKLQGSRFVFALTSQCLGGKNRMSGPQNHPFMARLVEAALTPELVIWFGQLRETEATYLSRTQETQVQKLEHQLRFRHANHILRRQLGFGSYSACFSGRLVCAFALVLRGVYPGSRLFLQRPRDVNTTANALS